MARSEPQINFRTPAKLKAQLDRAVGRSGNSLTAEIVRRLELSFEDDPELVEAQRKLASDTKTIGLLQEQVEVLKNQGVLLQQLMGHEVVERIRVARAFSELVRGLRKSRKMSAGELTELLGLSERAEKLPAKAFLEAAKEAAKVIEDKLKLHEPERSSSNGD